MAYPYDKQASDSRTASDKAATVAAKDEATFHDNKRPLSGRPGESGDPDVHYLLAVRDGLQQNRDALDPPKTPARDEEIAGIDAKLANVDKQLADLGYKGK